MNKDCEVRLTNFHMARMQARDGSALNKVLTASRKHVNKCYRGCKKDEVRNGKDTWSKYHKSRCTVAEDLKNFRS